jgi:A/G-specific adenine glycosylase
LNELNTTHFMHPKIAFSEDVGLTMARNELQRWYLEHERPLPWREQPAPYGTWLCEVIMQQTRIDQGTAYWERFMHRWPNFQSLADASVDEVLKEWQGLGYYSRARNLHKTAQIICDEYPQGHPTELNQWLALPGVGAYTAAAICSICFGTPVAAVDGNVLRVLSRFLGIHEPIDRPSGRKPLEAFAEAWVDPKHPGRHNQALMELGALICTPHAPDCAHCPLQKECTSSFMPHKKGSMPPFKQGKTKVQDVALHFHVIHQNGRILMQQRPDHGIWGGLWTFPSSEAPWEGSINNDVIPEPLDQCLIARGPCGTSVKHLLSHRRFHVQFWLWSCPEDCTLEMGEWHRWDSAELLALPRVLESSWEDVKNSASQKESKTNA